MLASSSFTPQSSLSTNKNSIRLTEGLVQRKKFATEPHSSKNSVFSEYLEGKDLQSDIIIFSIDQTESTENLASQVEETYLEKTIDNENDKKLNFHYLDASGKATRPESLFNYSSEVFSNNGSTPPNRFYL